MYPACQRTEANTGPTNFESGNELAECNHKKVKVEKELELLVEDDGKERDDAVLLVADEVGREGRAPACAPHQ